MQDTSTPSPSDPDPSDSGDEETSSQSKKKPLKLKRIVFEDTELNLPQKEREEATPESQAYEEPDEAPAPEEFRQQGHDENPDKPSEESLPLQTPQTESGDNPDQEAEAKAEERERPKPEGKVEQEVKEPKSPLKRLLIILIPAAVAAGALLILNQIFDPFGDEFTRIQPTDQPISNNQIEEATSIPKETEQSALAVSDIPEASKTISAAAFVEAIKKQRLIASAKPKGLFIGSVFIPEGQPINPETGLVLSSVTIGDFESVAVMTSSSGERFPVPLVSGKK